MKKNYFFTGGWTGLIEARQVFMSRMNGKYEISKKKLLSVGLALVILAAGIGAGVTVVLSREGGSSGESEPSGGSEPEPVLVSKSSELGDTDGDPSPERVTIHFTVRNDGAEGDCGISYMLVIANNRDYSGTIILHLGSGETESGYRDFPVSKYAFVEDFRMVCD